MNAHWRRNRKRDTDGRIHVNCWLCDSWQADYIGLCVDFRNNTDLSWCSWLKCDRECETCSEIDKSSQFAFVLNILVVLYNIRQHTKIVLSFWSIFFRYLYSFLTQNQYPKNKLILYFELLVYKVREQHTRMDYIQI